jgi:hypothetical protein
MTLALVVLATGCSSMVFNVSQPKAAQLSFERNYLVWHSWQKQSTPLPATVSLNAHTWIWPWDYCTARITDIPLHRGTVIYVKIKTYGNTPFTKAGQVPLDISPADIETVENGGVVRMVLVQPKGRYDTGCHLMQFRLALGEKPVKRGKELGTPVAFVVLGNREP